MNMAEHREVRVTARQSMRKDFIAPDLSPVSLLDRELEKGKAGWTDKDVKVTDLTGHHLPTGLVERQLEEMKVGTVIARKGEVRSVARKRPTTRRWK